MSKKLYLSCAVTSALFFSACNPADVETPQPTPAPVVQLEAALYDTCIWSEEYNDLRCWGYNEGAHGNGYEDAVGDSFGEILTTNNYCKNAADDQWRIDVDITDVRGSCSAGRTEINISVFNELDQVVTTDTLCERGSASTEKLSTTETLAADASTCEFGGYVVYTGDDSNKDGTLQLKEMGESLRPTLLPDGLTVNDFAIGENYGCALLSDKTTRCWGVGSQIGNADSAVDEITDIADLGNQLPIVDLGTGRTASKLSSVEDTVCALLDNGRVKCWGNNNYGQLGQGHNNRIGGEDNSMGDNLLPIDLGTNPFNLAPYKAADIATSGDTVCAVLEDGKVKCWGENDDGLLGIGYSAYDNDTLNPRYRTGDAPDEMGDSLGYVSLPDGVKANAIYMAYDHACVTASANQLYCWGNNGDGQLGLGDSDDRGDGIYSRQSAYKSGSNANRKQQIIELDNTVEGQTLCPLATNTGGLRASVYADNNLNDTIDDGELLLERLVCDADDRTAYIDVSIRSSLIIMTVGQYGTDFTEMGNALEPVDLGTTANIIDVAVGYYNTCVLFDDNSLICWGDGDTRGADFDENAGDTPLNTPNTLVGVDLGTDKVIADIAAAGYQTCAAFTDATVKCWGYNEYGEAGYPQYFEEYIGDGDPEPEMGENLPFVDVR
ncbi:Uncharacterised protein [BD1-7 clade bacterium]|uniref:Regulator of chromosome condensation (RCC1) repeat protein n=1 Tax=BD1-7 clade bacterium TaxID=2029982 RepID=A0A5S9PKV3_9GAMM|nr:Uncharacterised protein [BD1-7 clade bacterium]